MLFCIYHYFLFSDRSSYVKPSGKGYCTIISVNTGTKPEHCQCRDGNQNIDSCRIRCDNDYECKGYSYHNDRSVCYIYTTSTCSDGCNKRNQGRIGDLRENKKDIGTKESGCYIKERVSWQCYKFFRFVTVIARLF